jgi:hypothetical protein
VRNLRADPRATVQIGDHAFAAVAREPEAGDEADAGRGALFAKYTGPGSDLTRWRDRGLLVALDLE